MGDNVRSDTSIARENGGERNEKKKHRRQPRVQLGGEAEPGGKHGHHVLSPGDEAMSQCVHIIRSDFMHSKPVTKTVAPYQQSLQSGQCRPLAGAIEKLPGGGR